MKVCDALWRRAKTSTDRCLSGTAREDLLTRGCQESRIVAIKPPKEGDLSSDGKGDIAAREAFKKLSVFTHPDKHDNSEASTEAFKMLNTERAHTESQAQREAEKRQGEGHGDPR